MRIFLLLIILTFSLKLLELLKSLGSRNVSINHGWTGVSLFSSFPSSHRSLPTVIVLIHIWPCSVVLICSFTTTDTLSSLQELFFRFRVILLLLLLLLLVYLWFGLGERTLWSIPLLFLIVVMVSRLLTCVFILCVTHMHILLWRWLFRWDWSVIAFTFKKLSFRLCRNSNRLRILLGLIWNILRCLIIVLTQLLCH